MATTTPNLGLKVWNLSTDVVRSSDLADNWNAIDADYTRPRTTNQAEKLAAVPSSSNFQGRLVYLTADHSGFKANSLIRYDGVSWTTVAGTPERHSSLPTVSNFQGRVIVLTGASGGFAASDVLVNTDGANAWKKVGGIGTGTSLPGSPVAGDLFFLTATSGGFEAYSLVAYNGSAWNRTEKRGVEIGSSLPGAPFAGQVYVVTTAGSGFEAYDVVRYNGSSWARVSGLPAGVINQYAGASAPAGWLLCDGSAVSRSTYAGLFSAISTTFGPGDGSTTFNLPDTRGRVPVGKGTHTDVDTLGDNEGETLANRRIKHKHSVAVTVNDPGHVHTEHDATSTAGAGSSGSLTQEGTRNTGSSTTGITVGVTVGPQTGAEPTDGPAFLTLNYIIKT